MPTAAADGRSAVAYDSYIDRYDRYIDRYVRYTTVGALRLADVRLCFYVLPAFLPSLHSTYRHTHPRIKSPPDYGASARLEPGAWSNMEPLHGLEPGAWSLRIGGLQTMVPGAQRLHV